MYEDVRQDLPLYGLLAEFEEADALLEAALHAHASGYRRLEAYSPFPIEGLPPAMGVPPTKLPWLVLLGGMAGGAGAYFMMWYSSVVDYPIISGGKPYHSWPSFIPITFELTILGASLTAFFAMWILNGLPRLHHPVFGAKDFERASHDRFFLEIRSTDPKFEAEATRRFLEDLHPLHVVEIPDDRGMA